MIMIIFRISVYLCVCLNFSGSFDMKSGSGGVRQYVTVERPIGTSKPVHVDRKFVAKSYLLTSSFPLQMLWCDLYCWLYESPKRPFSFTLDLCELMVASENSKWRLLLLLFVFWPYIRRSVVRMHKRDETGRYRDIWGIYDIVWLFWMSFFWNKI
jgi:hypothetical protein